MDFTIDASRFAAAAARLEARRKAAVADMMADLERAGENPEPTIVGIIYDTQVAPFTTNRKQLEERGVVVPDPRLVDDESLEAHIMWVATALSHLGIYLVNTDHLDSRTLYRRLCHNILDEKIREMPPVADAAEFIDMAGGVEGGALSTVCAAYGEPTRAGGTELPGRGRDGRLPRPNKRENIENEKIVVVTQ